MNRGYEQIQDTGRLKCQLKIDPGIVTGRFKAERFIADLQIIHVLRDRLKSEELAAVIKLNIFQSSLGKPDLPQNGGQPAAEQSCGISGWYFSESD